jgi:hypothetical protein
MSLFFMISIHEVKARQRDHVRPTLLLIIFHLRKYWKKKSTKFATSRRRATINVVTTIFHETHLQFYGLLFFLLQKLNNTFT